MHIRKDEVYIKVIVTDYHNIFDNNINRAICIACRRN